MPTTLFPGADGKPGASLAASELLALIHAFDWSETPAGPIEHWPDALKMTTRLMVASAVPMTMFIGPDGILVYNDAYIGIAGKRHPKCFGKSVFEGWPEVAEFNRDVLERGLRGETLTFSDQPLVLYRNGSAERVWLDLDYSPVFDADGKVLAVLAILSDTSKRIRTEQALAKSEERLALALEASGVVGTWDWHVPEELVYSDERFARLYSVAPEDAERGAPTQSYIKAIHEDDLDRVVTAIDRTIAEGVPFSEVYRLYQMDGTVRWVDTRGTAIMDKDGRCVRFTGAAVDITERKAIEEKLANSELGLRTLTDAMPQMVWSTRSDGHHDYFNARWYEFTGVPLNTEVSEEWNGLFHPDDRSRIRKAWRHSLKTGTPYEIDYRLKHRSGEYRWILGRAVPIRNLAGKITRWFGTCTDIHETKLAASEREIINYELSHRIKNLFSVLSAIVSLSSRSVPEAHGFAEELRGRIQAMGRAYDLVRPHGAHIASEEGQTRISALLDELFDPYVKDNEERILFIGADSLINDSAATSLALVFHELATNSAKYGALSHSSGLVEVSARKEEGMYCLSWAEHGGPEVTEPENTDGFGSKLMSMSIEGQLGGSIAKRWDRDGLQVDMTIPLSKMSKHKA
ncbi:MAG: PAS domain-containing protein [Phyllobacterium sp.]